MQTLNDALYQLYVSREVTEDECLRVSSDPNEFLRMIGRNRRTRSPSRSVRCRQLEAIGEMGKMGDGR
jgi:Tfp pilus assembly ATPase PilU